ncbi:hypothetical protein ACWEWG_11300 [Streptomyces sp. NPDC003758]
MRGSGKSVLLRPDLARLVTDPLSALVMVDMKRIEGALWRHCARVAVMPDEIEAVAAELVAEMYERTALLEESGRAAWTPTPERPRIILLVDEGAEVLASVKGAMPNLSTLARLGRALEIHVWWCTQKPTMSGSSAGIDPQIAACCDVRVGLSVATPTEAQTVFGAPGWPADRLPKRGWFLATLPDGSRGATQARSWFVSDEQIRPFPPRAPCRARPRTGARLLRRARRLLRRRAAVPC